jgi:hypothetical protein
MKKSIGLACLAALMLTGCRVTVITDSTESTTSSVVSTVESVSTETFEEKLTDNGFTLKGPDQASMYDASHPNNAGLTLKGTFDWAYTASLSAESAYSSDQSIIPDSAITVMTESSYNTGLIVEVDIMIDLTQVVKAGDVYIKGHFKSNNVSKEATVCKKLTIVPFGTVKAPTYQETLKLDWSALKLESPKSIVFQMTDADSQYGLVNPNISDDTKKYSDFWQYQLVSETKTVKDISFTYFVGHRYGLVFQVTTAKDALVNYEISAVVGAGSTATGFNQYKNNFLTFASDNGSLTLTVTTTTYA